MKGSLASGGAMLGHMCCG